jgi:DNA-binding LacI/PurR family transcriptional regulator
MDGALVYSCDPEATAVDWLLRRRLPLVFIDQVPADGVPAVNVADRDGARAAAQHLVDLGHRRVGIVTSGVRGPHGMVTPGDLNDGFVGSQRLAGWLDALEPAGVTPPIARQPHGDPEAGYQAARMLLAAPQPPTAILCFSDAMAQGVISAALDAGLSVPEDLSVVGFDDSPGSARLRPPLTTVRQDIHAKGHAAAAALTQAIGAARNGSPGPAAHLCLPTELIVRGSTAAPR